MKFYLTCFLFTFYLAPAHSFNVILDAGHGGQDKGTSYQNKIFESDLTLTMTNKIFNILKDKFYPFSEVHLSRSNNQFIALNERAHISKEKNADLFVSIHFNSSYLSSMQGMEIYIPSSGITSNSQFIIDQIKQDIEETGKINQSLEFAHILQDHWNLSKSSIRRAPFVVIENNTTPSVLVEIGYLSHNEEGPWLIDQNNHDKMAEQIASAIITFKESRDKKRPKQ